MKCLCSNNGLREWGSVHPAFSADATMLKGHVLHHTLGEGSQRGPPQGGFVFLLWVCIAASLLLEIWTGLCSEYTTLTSHWAAECQIPVAQQPFQKGKQATTRNSNWQQPCNSVLQRCPAKTTQLSFFVPNTHLNPSTSENKQRVAFLSVVL